MCDGAVGGQIGCARPPPTATSPVADWLGLLYLHTCEVRQQGRQAQVAGCRMVTTDCWSWADDTCKTNIIQHLLTS